MVALEHSFPIRLGMAPIPQFVQEKLSGGELVRWIGRPSPLRYALATGAFTFVFGIVWTAILIPGFYRGFSLPPAVFGLIGVWILSTPFVKFYEAKRSIVYVVTNERALIFSGVFSMNFVSVTPRNMSTLELHTNRYLGDTIVLDRHARYENTGEGMGWVTRTTSFIAISDSKEPFTALQEMKRAQAAPG
jgi:hypothetical protein